jgi:hypothetical protein
MQKYKFWYLAIFTICSFTSGHFFSSFPSFLFKILVSSKKADVNKDACKYYSPLATEVLPPWA